VGFDCQTSWVWLNDGAPGWYVLPPDVVTSDGVPPDEADWWADALGQFAPFEVYRHAASAFGPAYVVYYWPGGDPAAALGPPPAEPLLPGPAELRNYVAAGNEWLTLWQATAATAEPLSIQAHSDTDEGPPQVADGLGFSADKWRPGDWFLQRHFFPAPSAALETGLYNYVTVQPVSGPIRLEAK
jgi:hypothetical protein